MKNFIRRFVPEPAVNALRRLRAQRGARKALSLRASEYWARRHVAAPEAGFDSVERSLLHYKWRNHVNLGQLELMPVDDVSGKVVLDYGCGPGNDVIGFSHYSRPARMLACDVSSMALAMARQRAALHGVTVEFSQIREAPVSLPYGDASIDVVHTAGVLHHTPDPGAILAEFHRVLKPGGEVRVMVYNRNSVWMHLYVSYVLMIERGLYRGLSPDDAFHLTTDGGSCPIAQCYRPEEFTAIGRAAGFDARFAGAGMTTLELDILPKRWAAIADRSVADESREFLYGLRMNDRGWPTHAGTAAGINGYYRLRRP